MVTCAYVLSNPRPPRKRYIQWRMCSAVVLLPRMQHVAALLLCCSPLYLLAMQQAQETCKANSLFANSDLEEGCLPRSNGSIHSALLHSDGDIASRLADINVLGRSPQPVVASGSDGIYVSLKTTGKYHKSRLELLLLTWMQTLAPCQVSIVTELGAGDRVLDVAQKLGFNVVKADCEASHSKQALNCKSGVEFEHFYRSRELGKQNRWFCHFDDDVYLNVPVLVEILEQFSPSEDKVYIGKVSINKDKKLHLKDTQLTQLPDYTQTTYSFATGAAYCLSSSLMTEVQPYLQGPLFQEYGRKLKLPDDMLVGAVVEAVLGYELVNDLRFNSHLHPLSRIKPDSLHKQATVSFGEFHFKNSLEPVKNVVSVPGATFDEVADPTRFLSIHCFLYPQTHWCSRHRHHHLQQ